MIQYILRRLLISIPIIWGAVTLVFFFVHLIPGDPVTLMIGDQPAPGQYEKIRAELKLDQPLSVQYKHYWIGLLQGDWGRSIVQDKPVIEIILRGFPYTLVLALAALMSTLMIAVPLGILSALNAGRPLDFVCMAIALIGVCLPTFWAGPLFQNIFAVQLNLLPVSGARSGWYLILPALTLGAALAGMSSRLLRSKFLDIQKSDFVVTARAKGLSEAKVVLKHILRNALIPMATIVGLQLGALLAGSIVTETIFNWPGLGLELVGAIQRRDFPVIQGIILWITISYVTVNLLTDLVVAWLSPQVRLS